MAEEDDKGRRRETKKETRRSRNLMSARLNALACVWEGGVVGRQGVRKR